MVPHELLTDAWPDLQRELCFHPFVNEHPRLLTREQIRQFNAKGYITGLRVFAPDEIALYRKYFDRLLERALQQGSSSYSISGWQDRCGGIYDLATHPRILDLVQDLLGENLICWSTHFFCKLPGDGKEVSWHQDASYWPLTPSRTVGVWLAIDDADRENGCMRFIPGSHLHGQISYRRSTETDHNVLSQSVDNPEAYGDAPVDVELKAGEISLHSDLLLHGSHQNTSSRRRCGLTLRYVPPEVQAFRDWNRKSILCRGRDDTGNWAHTPRPMEEPI